MLDRIRNLWNERGQAHTFILMIVAVFVGALTIVMVPLMMAGSSVSASITRLEDEGYAVLAAGEYASLSARIDALKVSADAAVATSQATLATLLLHNENEVFLYPESVSATVTFTAGNGVDTWGAWTEITDSGADTLTSKFAANDGYIVEITVRNYSVANEIYMIELATDNGGANIIGRVKVRSDWTYVMALRSTQVTTGDTIYYRMKAETALATVLADFRYYYE